MKNHITDIQNLFFDVNLENNSNILGVSSINSDFLNFFNLNDVNEKIFFVDLDEESKKSKDLNEDFCKIFNLNEPPKTVNDFNYLNLQPNKFNFNFSLNENKFPYEKLNSSFSDIFQETVDDEIKDVNQYFRVNKEQDEFRVIFTENFKEKDFLEVNKQFETFFDCPKEESVTVIKPEPNFDILRKNIPLNFKTLNEEFDSFFSEKIINVEIVKKLKDIKIDLDEQVQKIELNFDINLNSEKEQKLTINENFQEFFDIIPNKTKFLKEDELVKAIKIDHSRRKEKVNFNKPDAQKSFPDFLFSDKKSNDKLKEEITKETDQIIDNKINEIKQQYNLLLNEEINQIQIDHQKDLDSLRIEHEKKMESISNEFQMFKKMMIDQMSSVKSTFLSATSGGGSVNILDMDDVNKTDLADGTYLKYDAQSRKFVFSEINVQGEVEQAADKDVFDQYDVTQEILTDGYVDLTNTADDTKYELSSAEVNGLSNNFSENYTFISNTRVDITGLELSVGDTLRILYKKV